MQQDKKDRIMVLELNKADIPISVEKITGPKKHVMWGIDNKYPYKVYNIYQNSAILQSIINSLTDFVVGDGIELNPSVTANVLKINSDNESLEDMIRRCVNDYILFGAFAIQVIRNKAGEISELYWLDMRRLRMDEDRKTFFYADWFKNSRKIITLPRFRPDSVDSTSVYFVTNKLEREVYPVSSWGGAMKAAMTSTEIGEFHLNSIINNFAPSAIVNFNNGVPPVEVQEEIEHKLNEKFSGASNASKLLIAFNESQEHAVAIERLGEDNFDQKYQALSESTMKELFTAFRINPILCGVNVETGFSKEEFMQAFKLANRVVVSPIQQVIENSLDILFKVDHSISFKEFKVFDDTIVDEVEKNQPEI